MAYSKVAATIASVLLTIGCSDIPVRYADEQDRTEKWYQWVAACGRLGGTIFANNPISRHDVNRKPPRPVDWNWEYPDDMKYPNGRPAIGNSYICVRR